MAFTPGSGTASRTSAASAMRPPPQRDEGPSASGVRHRRRIKSERGAIETYALLVREPSNCFLGGTNGPGASGRGIAVRRHLLPVTRNVAEVVGEVARILRFQG